MERALAATERARGPEHHEVALRLYNLAAVLKDVGRPGDARPLLLRALAIAERELPPAHSLLAKITDSLAGLA